MALEFGLLPWEFEERLSIEEFVELGEFFRIRAERQEAAHKRARPKHAPAPRAPRKQRITAE